MPLSFGLSDASTQRTRREKRRKTHQGTPSFSINSLGGPARPRTVSSTSRPPRARRSQTFNLERNPEPPTRSDPKPSADGPPRSYMDLRREQTGYSPPGSPYLEWEEKWQANNAFMAHSGRPVLPPPPPVYVALRENPQVVYVDTQTGQPLPHPPNQGGPSNALVPPPPPPGLWAPYKSPFKHRLQHLGIDLLEGAGYVVCTTLATYLMNGLLRTLIDPNPSPRMYE